MVKASASNAVGAVSIPGRGVKSPTDLTAKNLKHKTEAIMQQIQQTF